MSPTGRRPAAPLAAFVLHQYPWSETSLILDLFTREQGRLAVAAKGAKRPYSQLRSVLLPFQRIQVTLSRPSRDEAAEIQTLRSAEWASGGPMLSGAALFSGFYLNELVIKLLARGDPHPALFDAYAGSLPVLADANADLTEPALRAFEIVLLREIGLLPELDRVTATQQALQPEASYQLHAEGGLTAAAFGASGLTGRQWAGLQATLDAGALSVLQGRCAESLPGLKASLRTLLHYHLGMPVMRTREVLRDAQQLMDGLPRRAIAQRSPSR
jgi:DNA repair protein RecO (recombination protein O)